MPVHTFHTPMSPYCPAEQFHIFLYFWIVFSSIPILLSPFHSFFWASHRISICPYAFSTVFYISHFRGVSFFRFLIQKQSYIFIQIFLVLFQGKYIISTFWTDFLYQKKEFVHNLFTHAFVVGYTMMDIKMLYMIKNVKSYLLTILYNSREQNHLNIMNLGHHNGDFWYVQNLSGMVKKYNITGFLKFAERLILLSCFKFFRLRVSRNKKYCSVKAYLNKKYKNEILVLSTIF